MYGKQNKTKQNKKKQRITAPVKLPIQRARQMIDTTRKILKYVRPCQEKVKRKRRIFEAGICKFS